MADNDVVIVGAGPYGLGGAAQLRRAGVDVRVFGELMSFWQRHMPVGMFLRSSGIDGCEIGEGTGALTVSSFGKATGTELANPLPLETFVEYGRWYQRTAVPDYDPRLVARVDRANGGFELELLDGEVVSANRVVVCAGIDRFAYVPDPIAHLPKELASHSIDHGSLASFAGKQVAVIGRGQSALEFAALLGEQGAAVELITRGEETRFLRGKRLREVFGPLSFLVYPPEDVGPPGINLLTARPDILRKLPRSTQVAIGKRAIRPAGAVWLVPRLGQLRTTLGVEVVAASESEDGRVELRLSDGSTRTVDHVLAATGFRVDIAKYAFLSERLVPQIAVVDGYPELSPGFESSVAGLHFLGAPAAWSFGPLMRFVSGTWFASRTLATAIARR
jgi:FAD-dependent urate hydroxylase